MDKEVNQFQKGFEPITSEQMYSIENNGEKIIGMKKLIMMENAGAKIAEFLLNSYNNNLIDKKIVFICGLGNNGGDAIVASRHISAYLSSKISLIDNNLVLILLGKPEQIKTYESKTNWNIIEKIESIKKILFNKDNKNEIEMEIQKSDIIIDGLLGTGIKGKIKDPYSDIIDFINRQKSKSFILAVDIPSGLNPDTGEITDKSIKADVTITFHRIKHGLLKNKEQSGEILPVKIGIPIEAERGVV
ncbi:MAG: NAD(P)H-hydrate epimerase [Candidatus Nitrosocosmicus sp.]